MVGITPEAVGPILATVGEAADLADDATTDGAGALSTGTMLDTAGEVGDLKADAVDLPAAEARPAWTCTRFAFAFFAILTSDFQSLFRQLTVKLLSCKGQTSRGVGGPDPRIARSFSKDFFTSALDQPETRIIGLPVSLWFGRPFQRS